jgi:hypothetical protein
LVTVFQRWLKNQRKRENDDVKEEIKTDEEDKL